MEKKYADQLATLFPMGFEDADMNLAALILMKGNVNEALNKLFSGDTVDVE